MKVVLTKKKFLEQFNLLKDEAAERCINDATVYYTDMDPASLGLEYYFKAGADWAKKQLDAVGEKRK